MRWNAVAMRSAGSVLNVKAPFKQDALNQARSSDAWPVPAGTCLAGFGSAAGALDLFEIAISHAQSVPANQDMTKCYWAMFVRFSQTPAS